jgi:hypothetical protein
VFFLFLIHTLHSWSAVVVKSCHLSHPSDVLLICPLHRSGGHICPVVGCHGVPLDVAQSLGIPHRLLVVSWSYTPQ